MWSEQEFCGGLQEFHGRNRSTLVRASACLYDNIGKSFSVALGASLRQSAAAILAKPKMTTDAMLEGHYEATLQRCRQSDSSYLVVPQDTTYYNLTSHKAMEGVGTLQGGLKDTLQHNTLALTSEGTPLGLLHQYNWTRGGVGHLERESEKWHLSLEKIRQVAGQVDKPLIVVQDREADMLSVLCAPLPKGVSLVVRLYQPRYMQAEHSTQYQQMQSVAEGLQEYTTTRVEITRHHQDITLALSVNWGLVTLRDTAGQPCTAWLVRATETGAVNKKGEDLFDGDQKAEWTLLCRLSEDLHFDAVEVIRWYSLRWRVERLHYVMKSGGLTVERLQFDDVNTFINALALYSIVAVRILQLTYSVRADGEQRADAYFTKTELIVLAHKHTTPVLTLKQAVLALGRLEGFAPTKRQPLPGPKCLGQALLHLQLLIDGFLMAQNLSLQD